MSLKMKLVSCVSAFIIVASLMLISVFAATNVTLNIGGNVTFQAVGVQATISQGVVANGAVADSASKMQAVTIDSENDGAAALATWSGLELSFDEDGAPMTITFDITNNHTEKDLQASISVTQGSTSNASVAVSAESGDANNILIPKNSGTANSETITITFTVADKDLSASIKGFEVSVVLTNKVSTTVTVNVNAEGYYDSSNRFSGHYIDSVYYYVNDDTSGVGLTSVAEAQSATYSFTLQDVDKIEFGSVGFGARGSLSIVVGEQDYTLSGNNATTGDITISGNTTITITCM